MILLCEGKACMNRGTTIELPCFWKRSEVASSLPFKVFRRAPRGESAGQLILSLGLTNLLWKIPDLCATYCPLSKVHKMDTTGTRGGKP